LQRTAGIAEFSQYGISGEVRAPAAIRGYMRFHDFHAFDQPNMRAFFVPLGQQ
jgi:hypothetical protein